jgi:nucleoside-diphosphate-sugar epimerase
MRVFVTGAGGHIGSAVIPELVQAGHEVVGLVRSDASAAAVKELGAESRRGDLTDLDGLRQAAADADGVIHLAFDHHTAMARGDFPAAAATDLAAIRAFGDALAGTNKVLMGIGLKHTGDPQIDARIDANPRSVGSQAVADLAERGVRSVVVAVPPVTHSSRDRHGFVPTLIEIARAKGVSGYVGEGTNCWPAGHTLDVARVFRLGLEKAPAGSQLFAATEEGIELREIAAVIGRRLGVPTASIPVEQAAEHFTNFPFVTLDIKMPNASTRELLGWEPSHPGLIADLEQGHYFAAE